jgi:hypothetical protein
LRLCRAFLNHLGGNYDLRVLLCPIMGRLFAEFRQMGSIRQELPSCECAVAAQAGSYNHHLTRG